MGRDRDGEKRYHCYNPDTAWRPKIYRMVDQILLEKAA